MRMATRKHLSVVKGLAQFAQVTVAQAEYQDAQASPPEPKIVLSEHPVTSFTDEDRVLIEAARRGIREAEVDLGWRGLGHYVVKIEGLEVDGINPEAARLAASDATRVLIQE